MTKCKWIPAILSASGLLVLILDSRTGFTAAQAGVTLCITTLVPSMFPFFMLSMIFTSSILGRKAKLLAPLGRICRIPSGAESLWFVGLLGGYPVGAQNVLAAYDQGGISREDAQRMAVFCNNAGPAFIFGYLSTLFDDSFYPWIIWGIHIVSSLLLGLLLPGSTHKPSQSQITRQITMTEAFYQSLGVMAKVCGWVILFRVLLGFGEHWLFWAIPDIGRYILSGLLELSNGCIMLSNLPSNGLKMVLASTFLGFGGLCVLLQTISITNRMSLPLYLPGKALQGCISFLLSYFVQLFLPDGHSVRFSPVILLSIILCSIILVVILRKQEKPVAFFDNLLYNQASCEKRRSICSSGKISKNPAPTVLSAQS